MKKAKRILGTLFIIIASVLILIIGNFIDLHKPHDR
jgi:hypothetical protein